MRQKALGNKIGDERADVDLTPMLDVVFIMLIFFIVTASFLTEKTLPVNHPDADKKQPEVVKESQNLVIQISGGGDIYIDKRRVDIRAVRSLVSQHMAENPGAGVVIRAHETSKTKTYVAVADEVQQAKSGSMVLMTYAD